MYVTSAARGRNIANTEIFDVVSEPTSHISLHLYNSRIKNQKLGILLLALTCLSEIVSVATEKGEKTVQGKVSPLQVKRLSVKKNAPDKSTAIRQPGDIFYMAIGHFSAGTPGLPSVPLEQLGTLHKG